MITYHLLLFEQVRKLSNPPFGLVDGACDSYMHARLRGQHRFATDTMCASNQCEHKCHAHTDPGCCWIFRVFSRSTPPTYRWVPEFQWVTSRWAHTRVQTFVRCEQVLKIKFLCERARSYIVVSFNMTECVCEGHRRDVSWFLCRCYCKYYV